jgi:hypothetical protein
MSLDVDFTGVSTLIETALAWVSDVDGAADFTGVSGLIETALEWVSDFTGVS